MATIKDKLKEVAKKAVDQVTTAVNNSASSSDAPSWIGSGNSPRTGKPTYGGSANTSAAISNGSSYDDDLQRLKRLQQEANVQQLKAQKDKTMQALAEREATVKPTFQNQRNATSAQSQRSARSFNEYLANRGLANSGAAAQGEINRASTLQNNLAAINTAETNELNEIARARANAEADYANNLAIANSQIEADYFSKLVEENQRQRLIDEQLKQQAQYQYADDYQARINELMAQGYSPNSREVLQLQALRGQKANNTYSNANSYNNALAQIQSGYINYNNAAQLGMTVEQAQQYYNQVKAQLAYERAQQEIANAQKWAQIENDKRNTDSLIASRQNSGNSSKANAVSFSTHKNIIDNNYTQKDTYDNFVVYDTEGIKNYIVRERQNGRLTEKDANSILANYGIDYTRETPKYKQIAEEVGNTRSVQQAEEVIYKYYLEGVNENIINKLMEDLRNEVI